MQGYMAPTPPNPRGSTIGEGFTFGCGFLLAGFLASLGMGLLFFLMTLLTAALGAALLPR